MLKLRHGLCVALLVGAGASVAQPLPPDRQPPEERRAAGKPVAKKSDANGLRMRIAAAVEGHPSFRTLLDGGAPRLLDAKIAGPLRGPENKGQYCVSIRFETSITRMAFVSEPDPLTGDRGLFVAVHMPEAGGIFGLVNMEAEECRTGYRPFPELQQLRTKRRVAQGLPP